MSIMNLGCGLSQTISSEVALLKVPLTFKRRPFKLSSGITFGNLVSFIPLTEGRGKEGARMKEKPFTATVSQYKVTTKAGGNWSSVTDGEYLEGK